MAKNLRNFLKIIALVLLDISAFYSSLLLAYYARTLIDMMGRGLTPLQLSLGYFLSIWWLPVVFISFIAYERLYIKNLPFWDESRDLFKAVSVSTISIIVIITLGKMLGDISRLTIILLWCFGLFLFPLFRHIGKKMLYSSRFWRENVIIIGAGNAGQATAKGIVNDTHLGYHVIGFLDDDEQRSSEVIVDGKPFKIFGKTKHFRKFVKRLEISTIIIAIPSLSVDRLTQLTNEIQKYAKSIMLVPDIKGVALTNTELYHLFVQQLFLLKINNNLKSPYNRFIKRVFDLVLPLIFLPLLLPLVAILGLCIKIDSPGAIFYRQSRVGQGGRTFHIYKFRSMYQDSRQRLGKILLADASAKQEWETFFKLKNDPRITRMGLFLRKTSLDELPQLFNVLKGEMSLVGPRPVLKEEITKYYKEFTDYYYMVRPGLTGLWQVSGRNNLDYEDRVRLDTWYVLNWSAWLDIIILFKTFRAVFNKEGAY